MTTDHPATAVASLAIAPTILSYSVRQRIFLYLGVLIVLLAFGAPSGGLIDIPISFFLKNKLQLKAHEVAEFRLVAAIPLYLSFIFGFIRDMWNPFGMRDRGFMLLFGTITAGLYVFFAFTPITYATLLVAVVLLTTSFLFVASAQNGLTSTIGQQHAMTGQISAVWNIFASIPTVGALLIGGTLSDVLEGRNADEAARILFLVGAAIMATVAVYAAWKPRSVYDLRPRRTRDHRVSAEERPKVGAALADLPGSVDLALVELRAWFNHAASVLPSKYPSCRGRSVGSVERHLRSFFHSDFHGVRPSLPEVCPEDLALLGNGHRSSTDGSVTLHSFDDRGFDRGRAPSASWAVLLLICG
jgi:BT1 family